MSEATTPIPQASPGRDYALQKEELDRAILNVTMSGRYILGDEVAAFEREFAAYVGVAHGIGVANGTDAVELALRGAGIGPGHHVATVSHTAVATVAAIERAGAIPVFIDVEPATMTMDPLAFEDAARSRARSKDQIRAVVIVHLYGQPADVAAIGDIARSHGIFVVEDCAQAHGAAVAGRRVGTFGDVAAFSFYPTKNLAAVGDGGLVATNDSRIGDRVRVLRQYGWRQRYVSDEPGVNSRLDEIQAAVLRVRLRSLDANNERRAEIAGRYDAALDGTEVLRPERLPTSKHAFHQYVIRSDARDELARTFESLGIHTAVHYPLPVHLQPAYRGRIGNLVPLAVTERLASEILSLPMFTALSDAEVDRVADALRSLTRLRASSASIH